MKRVFKEMTHEEWIAYGEELVGLGPINSNEKAAEYRAVYLKYHGIDLSKIAPRKERD